MNFGMGRWEKPKKRKKNWLFKTMPWASGFLQEISAFMFSCESLQDVMLALVLVQF